MKSNKKIFVTTHFDAILISSSDIKSIYGIYSHNDFIFIRLHTVLHTTHSTCAFQFYLRISLLILFILQYKLTSLNYIIFFITSDMTPGERYSIQVNTVSYGVESPSPQQVNQTVRPNPVSNIFPLSDSNNITLEWPRPEGRVETYVLSWWPSEKPEEVHTKNVSEANVCKYKK